MTVLERAAPLVEMTRFVGDDFIENAVTVLCESRSLLAVFDTAGVITAQLATLSLATKAHAKS
jgi:hypothetical protein